MKRNDLNEMIDRAVRSTLSEMMYEKKTKVDSKAEKKDEDEILSKNMSKKVNSIKDQLENTGTDEYLSYNLTRSQLAYELYPDMEPSSARSKLSQKIEGKKRFKAWEINRLYNIISGKIG